MYDPRPDWVLTVTRIRVKNAETQQRLTRENADLRAELETTRAIARAGSIDLYARPPIDLLDAWRTDLPHYRIANVIVDGHPVTLVVTGPARPTDLVRELRDWQQIIAVRRRMRDQVHRGIDRLAFGELPEGIQACRDAGDGTLILLNVAAPHAEQKAALGALKRGLAALLPVSMLPQLAALSLAVVGVGPAIEEHLYTPPNAFIVSLAPAPVLRPAVHRQLAIIQLAPAKHHPVVKTFVVKKTTQTVKVKLGKVKAKKGN